MIRRLMVCLCVLTGALWLAPLAIAAECGGSAGGGEPLAGALLLRTEQSTSELSFKRDKEDRRLILVFDVKECTLPADAKIEVKMRSSELEVGSVFGDPEVEPEGSVLTVEVPVDPEAFDAGTHSASMTLQAAR